MSMDALFDMTEYDAPSDARTTLESCDMGTIAELEFMTQAKRRLWHVYAPFGHATPADAILFRPPGRPITVQVKKGQSRGVGRYGWKVMIGAGRPTCASNPNDYGTRYRKYERGDFDVLAMYVDELREFVFWTLDELLEQGGTWANWKETGARNNWEIFEKLAAKPEPVFVTLAQPGLPGSVVTISSVMQENGMATIRTIQP